jgi:hypothetical protein
VLTDEELLRDRLGRLIGRVNAGPAPVSAVLQRGRAMRIGHRVAAGIAVIVSGAAVAAAMTGFAHIHGHRGAGPVTPLKRSAGRPRLPVQRVIRLPARAHDGVVAEGTSRGSGWNDTWRVWIDPRTGKVYDGIVGFSPRVAGDLGKARLTNAIATFYYGNIEAWSGTYAVVAPDVTRVVVSVTGGQRLTLYPVEEAGRRWIGLMMPLTMYAATETAYSGRTELGHMMTFSGDPVTWLRPGQSGLPIQTARIGSGFVPKHSRFPWLATVQAGPWGYCMALNGYQTNGIYADCLTPAQAKDPGVKAVASSRPARLARWLVGTAKPAVAYLELSFADGSAIRVRTVSVDGQLFYALAIVEGQHAVRWGAFGANGRKLYGGVGAPGLSR